MNITARSLSVNTCRKPVPYGWSFMAFDLLLITCLLSNRRDRTVDAPLVAMSFWTLLVIIFLYVIRLVWRNSFVQLGSHSAKKKF